MLDDLLGRTELRERIEELEEENRHLERQLDAEQDRRADAATARQEAQREANRLRDRVAELEDRVDRLQGDDTEPTVHRTERLRGDRLQEVLDRLRTVRTGPEGLLTAMVHDGRSLPDQVRTGFGDRAVLVSRAAPCLAVTDDAGLFGVCLSVPDPPEPFAAWDEEVRIDRAWFEPRGRFTFALVRSDLFAMGTYDGDERVGFHGFTGDLDNQHSKGGFSQARFERLRDEQIDDHLDRCRAAIEARSADRLYLVGERSVTGALADLAAVTATADATGDPEPALDDAFDDFWSVQLRSV